MCELKRIDLYRIVLKSGLTEQALMPEYALRVDPAIGMASKLKVD